MGNLIKQPIRDRQSDRDREGWGGGPYNYCNCATAVRLMREAVRQRISPSLCLALQQVPQSFSSQMSPNCQTAFFKTDFRGYNMYHDIQRKDLKHPRKVHWGTFWKRRVAKNTAKVKQGWQVAIWNVSGSSTWHVTTKAGEVVRGELERFLWDKATSGKRVRTDHLPLAPVLDSLQ